MMQRTKLKTIETSKNSMGCETSPKKNVINQLNMFFIVF